MIVLPIPGKSTKWTITPSL